MALLKDIPIKFPSLLSSEFGKKPEIGSLFDSKQSFVRALRTDRKKPEPLPIKYFDMEVRVDPALKDDEVVFTSTLADHVVTMTRLSAEEMTKSLAAFTDALITNDKLQPYQKALLDDLDDAATYIKPIYPGWYRHTFPVSNIITGTLELPELTIHSSEAELKSRGYLKMISPDSTQAGVFSTKNAIDLRNAGWIEVPHNACEACWGVRSDEPCWHCDGTGEDPTL